MMTDTSKNDGEFICVVCGLKHKLGDKCYGIGIDPTEGKDETAVTKVKYSTLPLPQSLRIGFFDYKVTSYVKEQADKDNLFGKITYSARTIEVDEQHGSAQTRTTLLHEVLHGIISHAGCPLNNNDEEIVVTLVANGLMQVFRDNPEFIEFIGKEEKGDEKIYKINFINEPPRQIPTQFSRPKI